MNGSPFQRRRQQLAAQLSRLGGGIAVVCNAPSRIRNGDSEHAYRHDSHFHYLTGFDEPHSWLVLEASGRSRFFCQRRDPDTEVWDGLRLGPERASAALGMDEAHPTEALEAMLPQWMAQAPKVWSLWHGAHPSSGPLARWLNPLGPGRPHADLTPLLADMRLFKDTQELSLMRRAAAISAGAHARAMRLCGERFRQRPDACVPEYEIEAELLHEFRRHGSQGPAYPSVVAAGGNACVLHHSAGATPLRAGELCLIDAGCELDGYASDITRTFPATGRFTAPQRALYDWVLQAQHAAVAATHPGARQRDAHDAALRVLVHGMLDLGLLDRSVHGQVDDVIESGVYRQFYMHSTGHWLGRDVHDVGDYLSLDEPLTTVRDASGQMGLRAPSRRLQPGMVVTLEPGLYVRPAHGVPEAFWHTGIRIEDDAVITATGCELISRGVPVHPDEIEALMREPL